MNNEKKVSKSYATTPSTFKKAKDKAFKEGMTLSEKIDQLLVAYVKKPKTAKTVLHFGSESFELK